MHAVGTPAPGRPLCDRCQHGIPKQALAGSKAERRRCQHAGCRQAPPQTWSKGQAMRGRPALARPLPQRPPGRLWRSGQSRRSSSASRERCHAAQPQHAAQLHPDQSDLTARAVKALNAEVVLGARTSQSGWAPCAACLATFTHTEIQQPTATAHERMICPDNAAGTLPRAHLCWA